jgi:hypothetical protein
VARTRSKQRSPAAAGTLRSRGRSPRPQTAATQTEAAMAERLRTLEPGTQRWTVLRTAIDFKRSWLELARVLTEVRDQGAYKSWSYRTFEAYAQHELHLRRETAQKLVRSFDFMASHEPRALETAEREPDAMALPSYQALDILAEARQNPYLSESDYRDLRDQVFHEDPAPSQLRKALRERAPEPPKPAEEPAVRLRRCLSLAERLYGMVLEEDVPDGVRRSVEEAVGGLRKLLDE